jgi:tetratricopeptide (TPR) repeat protein
MRFPAILAALLLLLASLSAHADVLVLHDGTQIEGKFKRSGDVYVVTLKTGQTMTVPAGSVRSIRLVPDAAPEDSEPAAVSRLQSLRRSVENLDDLDRIISRYENFLQANRDAGVQIEAQIELDQWKLRKEQGLVKLGSKWLTPAERTAAVAESEKFAVAAKSAVAAGRADDATRLLEQSLAADPENVAALYLRGLVAYQSERLPDARRDFEAVHQKLLDHAPTYNNLAVVLWKQKAQVPAIGFFDRAMTAAPHNKLILDNVAEALGALDASKLRQAPVARARARFLEQDRVLAERMAREGLSRWGSQWISDAEKARLSEARMELERQKALMQREFDAARARLASIDREIQFARDELARIASRTWYQDRDGRWFQTALPPSYFEWQQEVVRLEREKQFVQNRIDSLRAEAERLPQQLPVPEYTGTFRIIGAEGTPLAGHAAPSQPPVDRAVSATRPS